jgi:hypothetical protein
MDEETWAGLQVPAATATVVEIDGSFCYCSGGTPVAIGWLQEELGWGGARGGLGEGEEGVGVEKEGRGVLVL